jgi:hypothetical protein
MSSLRSSLYRSACRGGHPPSPRTSSVEVDLLCKISLGQDKGSLSDFSLINAPPVVGALGVSTRSAATRARGASAGESGSTPLRHTVFLLYHGGGESRSQDKPIHEWKGTRQPQKRGGGGIFSSQSAIPRRSSTPQSCVLINEGAYELFCLGGIGGGSSRFCIANKMQGYTHCSTKSHALDKQGTSKFVPQVNHFYPPGGEVSGNTTLLMDPSVHINKVPHHMQVMFFEGQFTSKQWVHKIIKATSYVQKMKFNTPKSSGGGAVESNESFVQEGLDDVELAMVPDGPDTDNQMDEDKEEFRFCWDDDISQLSEGTEWRPVARLHRAALELLWQAITSNTKEVRSLKTSLSYKINEAIKEQLGELDYLIHEHGSLANAMSMAIYASSLSLEDVVELQSKMDNFGNKLQAFAEAADVSKEYMMGLMTKVLDIACKGTQRAFGSHAPYQAVVGTQDAGDRGPTPHSPAPAPSTLEYC